MAGVREQKKKETMDAIKAAAVRLFTEKGFEQTSIEEIANEAGIGKTTVYGYFSTKDEIFKNYCFDEFKKTFNKVRENGFIERPLIDNLVDFFMLQYTFVTSNRELGRQLLREMTFPASINDKAKEHDQQYFDILGKIFQIAVDNGEIRHRDDDIFVIYHFYALYLGVLAGWYTGYVNNYEEAENSMKTLFQQAIEGIA